MKESKESKVSTKTIGDFSGYKKSGSTGIKPKKRTEYHDPLQNRNWNIPYRGYWTESVSQGSYEDYI